MHPYTSDLDVFGKNSLFLLINRTTSIIGLNLFARRLKNGLDQVKITEYQQAVKSLAQDMEWSQAYQAMGMHYDTSVQKEFDQFELWCQEKPILLKKAWIKPLSILLPALLIITVAICATTGLTYYLTLPFIIINAVMVNKYWQYADETVESTYQSVNLLKSLHLQIELLERKAFDEPMLNILAEPFQATALRVSQEIKQLGFLLGQLQARENKFHILFNLAFLLDIHWLTRLEKWKLEHASVVKGWFDRLAEFEVLISLSGTAFANPHWHYPQSSNVEYHVEATALGHPMLKPEASIANDFVMQGKGEVILLTGPNMAGKSTFLRTVAINIVLARMGAPVCAAQMTLNFDIEPFTAMRVADDLSENVSSFYAELKRINQLLETVGENRQIIYFLDEILKGTNSADRHKGAEGLIRQLSELGVSGFVSTHDLKLGELAGEMEKVTNYSFESEVKGDEIIFDYKLRDGICTSFNACDLMRKMGIEI